eukprot:2278540-Amphidinium_carterae.1
MEVVEELCCSVSSSSTHCDGPSQMSLYFGGGTCDMMHFHPLTGSASSTHRCQLGGGVRIRHMRPIARSEESDRVEDFVSFEPPGTIDNVWTPP